VPFNARPDILHSPNYLLPDWAEGGIITVHDLSVFRYPETHPAERIASFEARFQTSLDRAQHLIVDCETIRREVIEFTGLKPSQVTAIPLGISPSFRPVSMEDRIPVLRSYGLPLGGYGLTLAALEPRKRIDRLMVAWRSLPKGVRNQFPLVVAGAAGWKNEALQQELDRGAGEGWLIPLGFVPEADLPSVYAGARIFAFPSLYEGFGLPPLEAMATGVPTIVASQSCLPEVTRGAAMEVNPDDVEGFAQSIQRALEDNGWRSRAIIDSIEVARSYTWDKCIDNTVDLYERCIN
jgi:alpha-1,3-rhamnosyl/mannosyltransferase